MTEAALLSPPLTLPEKSRLSELVVIVKGGMDTFVSVGRALRELRDCRLYRETHQTFEAFCRDEFGFGRDYAHKLIAAVKVHEAVDGRIQTEYQARQLTGLDPAEARAAFAEAVLEFGENPSADQLEKVVHRRNRPRRIEPGLFWGQIEPALRGLGGSITSFEGSAGFDEDWAGSVIGYLPKHPELIDTLFYRAGSSQVPHAVGVTLAETHAPWFRTLKAFPRCFTEHPKEQLVCFYSGSDPDLFARLLAPLGETYTLMRVA